MAQVVNAGANLVKLNNGQTVTAQTGGWYDGQQYWNGTLGSAGQFNSQNNQPGQQGQAYVAPQDQAYINQQRQQANQAPLNFSNPAPTPAPAPNSSQSPSGAGLGYTAPTQPTIDLNGLYSTLTQKAGISDKQAMIDKLTEGLNTEKSTINDNPYLSEADRTGRIAKLESDYQGQVAPIQNDIALAQADVQTKLNLAQQQYNIDEGNYQNKVNTINNLLSSGALDNASAQDISQIALATGLSTGMVQSVIDNSKSAKAAQNKPQLLTVDDGVNQKLVAVDPTSGNIIGSQILGASTKTTSGNGGSSTSPGGGAYTTQQYNKAVSIIKGQDVTNYGTADKLLAPWEVKAAIEQAAAYLGGDTNAAADLIALAMNSEGYKLWNG